MADLAGLARLLEVTLWPITTLVAVLLLRRPLVDLFGRAKSIELSGLKVDLKDKLDDARQAAEQAGLTYLFPQPTTTMPPLAASPAPVDVKPQTASAPFAAGAPAQADPWQPMPPRSDVPSPLSDALNAAIRGSATILFGSDHRAAAIKEARVDPALFLRNLYQSVYVDIKLIAAHIARVDPSSARETNPVDLLRSKTVINDGMHAVFTALQSARDLSAQSGSPTLTVAEMADWSGLTLGLRQRLDQRARMLGFSPQDTPPSRTAPATKEKTR